MLIIQTVSLRPSQSRTNTPFTSVTAYDTPTPAPEHFGLTAAQAEWLDHSYLDYLGRQLRLWDKKGGLTPFLKTLTVSIPEGSS